MLNNSSLALKDRHLRARRDPDPCALWCGHGWSVLLGLAQGTDPGLTVFGGVAVAVTYK